MIRKDTANGNKATTSMSFGGGTFFEVGPMEDQSAFWSDEDDKTRSSVSGYFGTFERELKNLFHLKEGRLNILMRLAICIKMIN